MVLTVDNLAIIKTQKRLMSLFFQCIPQFKLHIAVELEMNTFNSSKQRFKKKAKHTFTIVQWPYGVVHNRRLKKVLVMPIE